MWDAILDDRGRQDDPHLWQRAAALGLDLERFERDRRSALVAARVERDFTGGIRAAVASTPAAFIGDRLIGERVEDELAELARSPHLYHPRRN